MAGWLLRLVCRQAGWLCRVALASLHRIHFAVAGARGALEISAFGAPNRNHSSRTYLAVVRRCQAATVRTTAPKSNNQRTRPDHYSWQTKEVTVADYSGSNWNITPVGRDRVLCRAAMEEAGRDSWRGWSQGCTQTGVFSESGKRRGTREKSSCGQRTTPNQTKCTKNEEGKERFLNVKRQGLFQLLMSKRIRTSGTKVRKKTEQERPTKQLPVSKWNAALSFWIIPLWLLSKSVNLLSTN